MESSFSPIKARGFTLVELLVVLAIITVISGVVLTGQNQFDNSLRITDTAYTLALSLRQVQTFGLSSRTASGSSNAGYGAHFDLATPTKYRLFVDIDPGSSIPTYCPVGSDPLAPDHKPGNCLYDRTTEIIQTYTFNRGFYVRQICGHDKFSSLTCTPTIVDVVFLRPNTNTIITDAVSGTQLKDLQIYLATPNGGQRVVCISYAGQISVVNSTCP